MNFAAAGDFPLGIVPGFRYNETESDISGAEEKNAEIQNNAGGIYCFGLLRRNLLHA